MVRPAPQHEQTFYRSRFGSRGSSSFAPTCSTAIPMSSESASRARSRSRSPVPSGAASGSASRSTEAGGEQSWLVTAMAQAGAELGCKVSDDIARLRAEQKRVKEERKRVSDQLRNATKRKQRLKHRARLLSTEDLVTIAAMRETEAREREARREGTGEESSTPPEPVAGGVSTSPRAAGELSADGQDSLIGDDAQLG